MIASFGIFCTAAGGLYSSMHPQPMAIFKPRCLQMEGAHLNQLHSYEVALLCMQTCRLVLQHRYHYHHIVTTMPDNLVCSSYPLVSHCFHPKSPHIGVVHVSLLACPGYKTMQEDFQAPDRPKHETLLSGRHSMQKSKYSRLRTHSLSAVETQLIHLPHQSFIH